MNNATTRQIQSNTKFLATLKSERTKLQVPRSNVVSQERVDLLLTSMVSDPSIGVKNKDEAAAVLAVLFQQGGTARSCDGNMTITLFDQEFKLARIRKCLKDQNLHKNERKVARTMATEIRHICNALELPGNLTQKIQRQNPERSFTEEEKVWLSDFQAVNTDCDPELRALILQSFKKPSNPSAEKRAGN